MFSRRRGRHRRHDPSGWWCRWRLDLPELTQVVVRAVAVAIVWLVERLMRS